MIFSNFIINSGMLYMSNCLRLLDYLSWKYSCRFFNRVWTLEMKQQFMDSNLQPQNQQNINVNMPCFWCFCMFLKLIVKLQSNDQLTSSSWLEPSQVGLSWLLYIQIWSSDSHPWLSGQLTNLDLHWSIDWTKNSSLSTSFESNERPPCLTSVY